MKLEHTDIIIAPYITEKSTDLKDQQRIMENDAFARVAKMLQGKTAQGGPDKLKSGDKISKDYLEALDREKWFEIRLKDDDANAALEAISKQLKDQKKNFDEQFETKKIKLRGKTKQAERKVKAGGIDYCLRTLPHPMYACKLRLDRNAEVPDVIIDPHYQKIQELIDG